MRKKITLALLSLLLVPLGMMAQDVTVHPDNGSMIPAVKQGGLRDTFYDWNGFATWKHNQLALTMTTGDSDNNSDGADVNGQLEKPANDIFATKIDQQNPNAPRYLQIGCGKGLDTYIVFSLPKGYRFTGYTIRFHRIAYPTPEGATVNTSGSSVTVNDDDVLNSSSNIAFGETSATFSFTNANKTVQKNISSSNTTKYTLTRTGNDTDMKNLLYFKLESSASGRRAYIQLDYVELNFTAEENYQTILPPPNITGKAAVNIPFITNKMDYGDLSPRDKDGYDLPISQGGRVSYMGSLHDLNANFALYEKGATKTVEDNGFDGMGGEMVDFDKSGSISSEGNYFKLDASEHGDLITTDDGQEAVYFIEAPIWATNSSAENGHKEPIGYRIIGASFDLKGADEPTPATFRIQHIGSDGKTYGLNSYEGTRIQYSQTLSYQTVWSIDEDGYIYYGTGNSKTYLAIYENQYYQYNNGRRYEFQVTTTKPSADANTFVIVDNNNGIKQIRLKNYDYYIGFYEFTSWGNTYSRAYLTTGEDDRAFYTLVSEGNDGTVAPYTFIIYDKTGTTRYKYPVNGRDRTVSINGLNNDAVKIGVIGTGYVSGRITMQALDPYIDRLNIVCQENGDQEVGGGKVTQQFNATDFSVKGGAFTFYVPQDFKGNAKFTFEDLYSKYGDETYYGNENSTNHARYYFMGSEYSGYEGNDVYARYKNTTHRNASYLKKIDCDIPGNVSFTFNNAAAVMSGQATTYEEYPFSLARYTAEGGNFTTEFIYNANEMDHTPEIVKTAYLFTCDEPRYNIAPTTATQHVAYAYYQMDIDMKKHTYAPILTWEKLYDNTFYSENNTDIVRDSQWGLKLTTEQVTDDQGTHSGYLTVTQIENAIATTTGIVKNIGKTVNDQNQNQIGQFDINEDGKIDENDLIAANSTVNGEGLPPTKSNQILYVDGSDLMSIMENQTASTSGSTTTYTTHELSDLQETLGKNVLFYLPFGSRPSSNNMAVNTISQYGEEYDPIFHSANDIKITDRYPFYAPYDIQVPGANYALYDRTVTNPTLLGDDDQHLTIVLPFEIDVDASGVHTNKDNQGTPFMLATMNSSNALAKKSKSHIDYGTDAYFTKISGENSEANKPYVVTMQSQTAGESAFKVHVKGALVKATPDKTGILTGEGPCTGTYTYEEDGVQKTDSYSFTHKGTYTGIEIGDEKAGGAAAASTKVFYFANNYFLDSKTLINNKSLKMLPFRSYYEYAGGAKAKMVKFRIVFGENDDDDTTGIGISEVQRNSNLAIIPGDGYITIMAKADSNVAIHTVNGMTVEKCNLRAGETRTVAMPSGIYVINGVKMVVR